MTFKSIFALLYAASLTLATSPLLAKRIAQPVSARGVNPAGGWSLSQNSGVSGLKFCGSGGYCPSSLTCVSTLGKGYKSVCCPSTSECAAALEASPFCADYSWSLWFATKNPSINNVQFGYFCCLPGQVGLMTADCVEADTVVAATLSASLVAAGSASVTTSSSSTSSSSAPSLTTPSLSPASGVSTSLSTMSIVPTTSVSTSSPPSNAPTSMPSSTSGRTVITSTSTSSLVAVTGTSGADASKGTVMSGGLGGFLLGIFAILLL